MIKILKILVLVPLFVLITFPVITAIYVLQMIEVIVTAIHEYIAGIGLKDD